MSRPDLLDPATLASLGRIEVVARWVVDGFFTGLHRSPRKGFSAEFAEHRQYQAGDELRHLDWKIAARADRWMLKQFEEETNLAATIVLDVSRSMAWTGDPARLTKLAYADRLAAAISLILLRQRDAVGLIRYDEHVRSAVVPRARRGQWRRIVTALGDPGSGKATRAAEALTRAARLVRRRGMVILISDLLCDPVEVERPVRALRAAGHDITVLHVMDPAEQELPGAGDALYVDPESGLEVPAVAGDVRTAYRETVRETIEEWRAMLAGAAAGYELVMTDMPFAIPLRRAFAARQRKP